MNRAMDPPMVHAIARVVAGVDTAADPTRSTLAYAERYEQTLRTLMAMSQSLDAIDVALCAFDEDDAVILWNRSFIAFFPEQAAHIRVGEPYEANLRRFYRTRLSDVELPFLERYVQDGVQRHHAQQRPFSFEHCGARLEVNVVDLPPLGRARIWKRLTHAAPADVRDDALHGALPAPAPVLPESTLLDHVADGVMVTDAQGRILWVNEPFVAMYGMDHRSAAVRLCFEDVYRIAWAHGAIAGAPLFDQGLADLEENLRYAGAPFELPLPEDRWSRVVAQRSPDGRSFYVHVDITVLKRQQHQLLRAQAHALESEACLVSKSLLLETTLEHMEQGIMMVNPDRVVEICNQRAMDLLDLPRSLMERRPTFAEVLTYQWEHDEFQHTPQDLLDFVRAGGILDTSHCYDRKRPDGRIIEIQSVPMQGGGVVRTYTDITHRRATEQRIRELAERDSLTSLFNRDVFMAALEGATAQSRRTGQVFAVYFLDLDGFKGINDGFGHAAGDAVLVQAADRMKAMAGSTDVLARLGGDEFALLGRGVTDVDSAMALAHKMLDGFRPPMRFEAHTFQLQASIGVSLYPSCGVDAQALLRAADVAMYKAKAGGRGRAHLSEHRPHAISGTSG